MECSSGKPQVDLSFSLASQNKEHWQACSRHMLICLGIQLYLLISCYITYKQTRLVYTFAVAFFALTMSTNSGFSDAPPTRAIDVREVSELLAVLRADTAPVQNTGALGHSWRDGRREELPHIGMGLLRLSGSGNFAGTDGPYGLVGDHDLAPVRLLEHVDYGLELLCNDLGGGACLSLLESLADTEDDAQINIQCSAGLLRDVFRGLVEEGAALRVTEEHPRNLGVD